MCCICVLYACIHSTQHTAMLVYACIIIIIIYSRMHVGRISYCDECLLLLTLLCGRIHLLGLFLLVRLDGAVAPNYRHYISTLYTQSAHRA